MNKILLLSLLNESKFYVWETWYLNALRAELLTGAD